ncbi:MAG: homoserine dehydrogenase [Gammaproteobacteria bacterium]|nr:homoserine dehydrogenase [Gammaproteobacteria bacterium]
MEPVKVGLVGLGTVGGGTVNVLRRNRKDIEGRAGRPIRVFMASTRDLSKQRICELDEFELTRDPYAVVDHPDIDVVVELIGGTSLALDLVLRAIFNRKHVVTANKALIAMHGNEIFAAAQEQGVTVAFEAAVAGGISIIKAIREGMAGNRIQWLAGIINGTGNYILTSMRDEARDFDDVLAEAQALGYAEADPSFDVDGIDAAHKLTILASIAFGIPLQFDRVYTEGIRDITVADIRMAAELGYEIKHLGIARRTAQGIEMRVHPTLIPQRQLLANVDGVMNAIWMYGDAVGPTLHYGAGAGAEPTASAVVADLVDVVRALTTDPTNRVPHLAFQTDALTDTPVLAPHDFETAYYLSMVALDKPGVLAEVTRILGDLEVSIEAILQKEPSPEDKTARIIILTQKTREGRLDAAVEAIEKLDPILGAVKRIRVEYLEDEAR